MIDDNFDLEQALMSAPRRLNIRNFIKVNAKLIATQIADGVSWSDVMSALAKKYGAPMNERTVRNYVSAFDPIRPLRLTKQSESASNHAVAIVRDDPFCTEAATGPFEPVQETDQSALAPHCTITADPKPPEPTHAPGDLQLAARPSTKFSPSKPPIKQQPVLAGDVRIEPPARQKSMILPKPGAARMPQ